MPVSRGTVLPPRAPLRLRRLAAVGACPVLPRERARAGRPVPCRAPTHLQLFARLARPEVQREPLHALGVAGARRERALLVQLPPRRVVGLPSQPHASISSFARIT